MMFVTADRSFTTSSLPLTHKRATLARHNTPASDQEDMTRELNRLQKQQRLDLCSRLKGSILNQVLRACRKLLELELSLELEEPWLEPAVRSAIVTRLVELSDQEPYGVRGGTLVVLFHPSPHDGKAPIQVGHFPLLESATVPTFTLHLTLQATTAVTQRVKLSLANLVRRAGGRPARVLLDPKFSLTKKKLYRWSTSD